MLSNVGDVSSKVSPVASPAENKAVEGRFAIHSWSPLGNNPSSINTELLLLLS